MWVGGIVDDRFSWLVLRFSCDRSHFSLYDSDRSYFLGSDRPRFRWKVMRMGDRTESNLEDEDDCAYPEYTV
ncbi:MAG: hypothetical protein F6K30_16190 [Cyanothece sp. SIO2G6]|nr:hypothetical protein [Cyanothece sp. SIO2G6]